MNSLFKRVKSRKTFLRSKTIAEKFNNRILFENVNFTIQHGEKIAIVGPNGSGKTTLLKMIMGNETAEGEVWISPSANIGYLTQEVFDLPLEKHQKIYFSKRRLKKEEKSKI